MEKTKCFDLYFEKLEKCGVSKESCELLKEKYGNVLNVASYATLNDSGMAYGGSLLEIVVTKLMAYAVKVNNLYPEDVRANVSSVVKVALLQHIAKSLRMEKCAENWRIQRGELYSYARLQPSIGTGLHSIAMATECGINLTPLECEAMTIIDRSTDDLQVKYHCNIIADVLRTANSMVYGEYNKKNNIIL